MGVQVCALPCVGVFSGVFGCVFYRVFAVCVGVFSLQNTRDEHPAGGLNPVPSQESVETHGEGRGASC